VAKESSWGFLPTSLSDLGQVVLAGASAALVLRAGGAGLKYLMEILFARWLGAEEYGAFAYAYNWAQLLSIFAGLGLVTTTLRFVPEYEVDKTWGKLRGLIVRSQQLTLGAGLVLTGLGVGLLWVFSSDHWYALFFGLISAVPMALINVQSSLIRGLKKITLAFLGRYVLWPLFSIAAVYALLRGTGKATGGIATVGVVIALSGIAVGQAGLIRGVFPSAVWETSADYTPTRTWIVVSLPLLLMSGFQIVLNRADVLMVGTFLGAKEAGLYNAAARTGRLLSFLLSASNAIAAPMISEYWTEGDLKALQNLVALVIRWVFWPSLILAVGLFTFSQPILRVFGDAFDVAWPVLVLVGCGQLVNAVTGPVGYLLGLTGHERASAWVFGVSAAVNLFLNVILVPVFGLIGGAVATMISVILQNLWLVVLVESKLGISIFSAWKRVFLFWGTTGR
jgi:O-antigen/teichoic acid export membrane protein